MGTAAKQESGTASNRYTLLGRIASGGMADIYLVRSTSEAGVDRHMVLKRVHAERSRDQALANMFLDEARLASQLQHPNIAQVYDVGTLEGAYFFTMEYVHGENIHAVLKALSRRKLPFPENLALYTAASALSALGHAHELAAPDGSPLNVVHRDVTPSNVMVSFDGTVKLLDFGVAKAQKRSAESRAGTIKGKVGYMSPEQCNSTKIDHRSDIFSMGIVLWEMLVCKRLYKRDTDFNTMTAITQEPVPPPSSIRPGLSPDIDRIVLTALEKDPDKRYSSAAAMAEEIEAVATAERHRLSAKAMAKFLKELFGSKPPPWVELRALDSLPLTSTTVPGLDEKTGTQAKGTQLLELASHLNEAPDLPRRDETPVPRAATVGDYSTGPVPIIDAGSSSFSGVSSSSGSDVAPLVAATPSRTRSVYVLAGIGALALVAGATVISTRSEPSTSAPATTPPVATVSADAASIDAANRPDAGPPDATATKVVTISESVTRSDWSTALALCTAATVSDLTDKEVMHCGVAACQQQQASTALRYHAALSRGSKRLLEVSCRDLGVQLAVPSVHRPAKDPCSDPAYVDKNPMKCF